MHNSREQQRKELELGAGWSTLQSYPWARWRPNTSTKERGSQVSHTAFTTAPPQGLKQSPGSLLVLAKGTKIQILANLHQSSRGGEKGKSCADWTRVRSHELGKVFFRFSNATQKNITPPLLPEGTRRLEESNRHSCAPLWISVKFF
jgi:hypothetical protein